MTTKITDNSKLDETARLERNRYYREYRAKNKKRVKEINARYWAKRARKTLDADKEVKTDA